MINWNKEKAMINLVIDALMLVLLMAIAGLGFLIKYVLIAGYKRNALYDGEVDLYFLGLDRHEWGNIHLWLGFILLFFLLLHIILHWNIVTCIFSRMIKTKAIRYFTGIFLLMGSLILVVLPFLISPETVPMPRRHIHNNNVIKEYGEEPHTTAHKVKPSNNVFPDENERLHRHQSDSKHERAHEQPDIYGNMTLEEVAEKYNIPLNEITKALNITYALPDERIGRLRKIYGFEMQDLRNIINKEDSIK
ncbi:MAG: DUF4405 domain-containing protein [Bacteroidales bacterium]